MLTTAGIILGVAVFVGMQRANRSVLLGFSAAVDRIAGKTELQVSAGETGFGEDVLDQVQAASSVRIAVPVIEAVVDSNINGEGNLLVLGIDMTGDRSLRDYDLENGGYDVVDDPLVFLAQPDSLIVSKEFAVRNHLAVGDRLPLGTVEGEKLFTIRGIMKSVGLATAFGGHLMIMDIYAAQKIFGRGRTFDRIDLAMKEGKTIAECRRELETVLGPAFDVQPPASRGQQFEAILAGYSMMVRISSAFALFIGVFIIYNSFAIAVAQRRSDIGIVRALGATRRQIRWLFLGESAVIGLLGSIAGMGVGILIGHAISASVSALVAGVYGVAQRAEEISPNPLEWAVALAIGVAASLAGAAIPAHAAARVDPVHALKKGMYQVLSARESRLRTVAAVILGATAVACLGGTGFRPIFYTGYVLVIVVALLLAPLLSLALTRSIRPILKWLWPVEGVLAADNLIQSPRRTSATVAALMLSLALVVAFSGMARASYDSIVEWMNTALNPDLFVLPSQSMDIQTTRFPATMSGEIAAVPGVRHVQMVRQGRITFRRTPVMIMAVEASSIARTAPRRPVAGNADEMYRKTAAGEGLMVSDNLAQLQRLAIGDVVELPAPYGVIRLPIVGVVVDYSDQQGTILIDRAVFVKYWHDESVSDFRIYVAPGGSVGEVRRRILERYAGRRQVFVLTNNDLKAYILSITDQWFGMTWVQIAVAVLVAILGIVNALTVSIIDRRRELGVLQAVGALRGQVRRTVWIEALTVAAVGLVLGCAFGAVNLFYMLQMVQRDIVGMRLDYTFPVTTVLALTPIMLGAGLVAAVGPAESAVRGSIVEALEYE
jgi:putative ABC transport system permease protein